MEILDDQQDRALLPEAAEDPEHALEKSRLAPLGHDGEDAPTGTLPIDAFRELRQQAHELVGRRAEDVREVLVRQRGEGRSQCPDDRVVRGVGRGTVGGTTHHRHRLLETGDAAQGLVDEPARADTGSPVDQQRP